MDTDKTISDLLCKIDHKLKYLDIPHNVSNELPESIFEPNKLLEINGHWRQMLTFVGVGNAGCELIDTFVNQINKVKEINKLLAISLNVTYIKLKDFQDIDNLDIRDIAANGPIYIFMVAGAADCALAGQAAAALAVSEKDTLKIGIMLENATRPANDKAMTGYKQNVNSLLLLSGQEIQQTLISRFISSLFNVYVGLIGVDFADVRCILNNGLLKFAVGSTNDCSEKRGEIATQAALQAISAKMPLDEIDGLLMVIWGGAHLSVIDIHNISDYICTHCKEETDILIQGVYQEVYYNDILETLFPDSLTVTLIAAKKHID